MNNVTIKTDDDLKKLMTNPNIQKTMLTEWFTANQQYEKAHELTYCEFPTKWTWDQTNRKWNERKHGFKIGRLYYVNPAEGERFYLRMLLMVVKGAKSYNDIKTYNGVVYNTFKDACSARGLLNNDNEWYQTFKEATTWSSSFQLRQLFVTMLLYCNIQDEMKFFEKNWRFMTDDFEHELEQKYHPIKHHTTDDQLRDMLLDDLQYILSRNGIQITSFNLPKRSIEYNNRYNNRLIEEETSYNIDQLEEEANILYGQLNTEQKIAFETIVESVLQNKPGFYFVSGYGGTGKTFLWNTIVSYLRARKKIVLAVASSGVASLLLPNGRTSHSRFKIPLDIDETSICDIKRGTILAELLIETSLVIWDEAIMTNKQCFEALDRSLRDIISQNDEKANAIPFGGKVVVLGGDLRQILPVIEYGTRSQIVDATIIRSYLWKDVKVIKLTKNMRLQNKNLSKEQQDELRDFTNWLLDLGDGKLPTTKHDNDEDPTWIRIPNDLLLLTHKPKIPALVNAIYPDFKQNYLNPTYLKERAILTPTNEIADDINAYISTLVPGEGKEYYSADSISKCFDACNDADILYPIEYLNSLNANNFPQHKLTLKKGVPIMLLRNINQSIGLCNGTRLIVTNLADNVIEALIITGSNIGCKVSIPRINLTTRGSKWPFVLNRRQFPIKVCYAMTINKSQGQTLCNVGIYLKKPVFTHGQLYVAASRVTNKNGLKILIEKEDGTCTNETKNIVYHEVFTYI